MTPNFIKTTKFFIILIIYIIVGVMGFNYLILQQENILRKYFIVDPQEKIKENNLSLADSLCKYFVRENKTSTLDDVIDYIKKYGRTSLFELLFVFKDNNNVRQISKAGVSTLTKATFANEKVYPVSIDNGRIPGYLLILIKETGAAELEAGFRKYKTISYSLRFLFLLLTGALLIIAFYHTYSAKMKLARDIAEMKASNDSLTGLHTHEYFMKALNIEIEKFKIYNTPIALLMLDIDNFKSFNDKFGHLAGDKVLQEVTKIIKSNTRATDILGRYGGEEFAVIVPYVAILSDKLDKKEKLKLFVHEIKNVAERIRRNVESAQIEFQNSPLTITMSIGGAFYYKRSAGISSHALLHRADNALYKAKRLGRNRVYIDYESSVGIKNPMKVVEGA